MDIATVIGLVVGSILVLAAVILGGSPAIFFNVPSVLLVIGGTVATAFIRFGIKDVLNSMAVAAKTFSSKLGKPQEIILEIVMLAHIARKNGLIVLEQQPINDDFLKKAVMYCVDGHEAEFIDEVLRKEVALTAERHDVGKKVFASMGGAAPAFGMIGTLIGLVQMLSGMDNPDTIGRAMAVALLTTLYGALIANLFCLPMADKLMLRSEEEQRNRKLIIEGVLGILKGLNPRVMEEFLQTFLPPKDRKISKKR